MRAWTTVVVDAHCGYADCLIPASTPALVVEAPGLRRRLRCPDHAGEPVGASGWLEVAEPNAQRLELRPFVPLRHVTAPLPFDHKAAAAGED